MEEQENPEKNEFIGKLLSVFFFILLFGWVFSFFNNIKKFFKKELYEVYSVDKKTFSKWVEYFCSDIVLIEDYKRGKKLEESIVLQIQERLGLPTDEMRVMNKKEIMDVTASSYKVMRLEIEKNGEKLGVSPEIYKSLSVFPPSISHRIIEHLGRA